MGQIAVVRDGIEYRLGAAILGADGVAAGSATVGTPTGTVAGADAMGSGAGAGAGSGSGRAEACG